MIEQPAMQRRRDATLATKNAFEGKPFALGTVDCARMVAFHLLQMGRGAQVGEVPPYDDPASARAALKALGVGSIVELADRHLTRIAPAAVLTGDLVSITSEGNDIGGLFIVIGNGRIFGFHEDAVSAVVLQPTEVPKAAWRVA